MKYKRFLPTADIINDVKSVVSYAKYYLMIYNGDRYLIYLDHIDTSVTSDRLILWGDVYALDDDDFTIKLNGFLVVSEKDFWNGIFMTDEI